MPKLRMLVSYQVCGVNYLATGKSEAIKMHLEEVHDLRRNAHAPILLDGGSLGRILVYVHGVDPVYGILDDKDDQKAPITTAGFENFSDAERAARYHMAQLTMQEKWIRDPVQRKDFLRWKKWQEAYAGAKAAGATDDNARLFAERTIG